MKQGRVARRKQFIEAALSGDTKTVRRVAQTDPSLVDASSGHGNSAIAKCVDAGLLDMVKLLITLGADPMQRNHGGHSLLDRACAIGHTDLIRLLLQKGNRPTLYSHVALGQIRHLDAAIKHDPDLVTRVLDTRRKYQLIHFAAQSLSVVSAAWLLDHGADVNAPAQVGHTPLSLTVRDGKARGEGVEMARFLLDRGADPNAPAGWNGGTVLHRAIACRDYDLVELLLNHEADADARDGGGKSPLYQAVSLNSQSMVGLVLTAGPKVIQRTSRVGTGGRSPLDYARQRRLTKIVEMLEDAVKS